MSRAIPARAKALVREFEDFRAKSYLCPAGVWTIGYGHTGPGVKQGQTCTKRQAELWLTEDLQEAAGRLKLRIGAVVDDLTDNQFGALCSFVFNLGANPGWTIWKKLKARDFDAVPTQLARFVYANGKKLNGLVRRRNAEIELWSLDEPGSADEPLSSAELRVIETPPVAAEKPGKVSFVTQGIGAASIAGAAVAEWAEPVKTAAKQLADLTDAPFIANAYQILLTIAGVCVLAGIVASALKHMKAKR